MAPAAWNAGASDWTSPDYVSSFHDQMMGDKQEQYNAFPDQSPPSQLSYGSGLSSLSSPSISSPRSPNIGSQDGAYFTGNTRAEANITGAKNAPNDSSTNRMLNSPPTGDLWNDYLAWDLLDPSSTAQPWDLAQDIVPTAGNDPTLGQSWQGSNMNDIQPMISTSSLSTSSVPVEQTTSNFFVSPTSASGNDQFGSPASSTSLNMPALSVNDPNLFSFTEGQSMMTGQNAGQSFSTSSAFDQAPGNYPFSSTWPPAEDSPGDGSASTSSLPVKKEKTQSPPQIPKTTPAVSFKSGKQRSQTAHKAVEKRYRTNLNAKIAELRDCIPGLRVPASPEGENDNDADDAPSGNNAQNFKKGVVLSKAAEYIQTLEERNKSLDDQVTLLQRRLNALQKIALAKTMQMNPRVLSEDHFDPNPASHPDYVARPQPSISAASFEGPMRRREANAAAMSMPTKPTRPSGITKATAENPRRGGRSAGVMSKLMVGGLAGLTMMEGLHESELSNNTPNARGLFALPLDLFVYTAQSLGLQGNLSSLSTGPLNLHIIMASFRALLVIGAMLYIFIPSLFDSQAKQEHKKPVNKAEVARSSVSSSLEARRNAWLTAIQTVWVPSHSLTYEFAALGLKIAKVILRNLVGWETYSYWAGLTDDDEIARVAAWDTAIESQLTGGDAEISIRRLLLTLIASTTLPETPGRLLLKALHLQVMLKEAVLTGYGRWFGLELLADRLSQHYWSRARKLQQSRKDQLQPDNYLSSKVLPDHLGELVNQEFEDVFVDPVIQRGYLLAWNKPLSYEDVATDEGMDQVVEDVEIRTPLDALAAWWSSLTLRKALMKSLDKQIKGEHESLLNRRMILAVKTAPPASGAEMRALAAQAVFSTAKEERKALIDQAIGAVPFSSSRGDDTPREGESKSIFIKPKVASLCTLSVRVALRCSIITSLGEDEEAWRAYSFSKKRLIDSLALSLDNEDMSLLGFASAYRLLQHLFEDRNLVANMSGEIEQLAAALRLLVGSSWSRQFGLSNRTVISCVETCLEICKEASGARSEGSEDEGYSSLEMSLDA